MSIFELRRNYHDRICSEIIRLREGKVVYPNFADGSNTSSVKIAEGIVERISCAATGDGISGQTAGGKFEVATMEFLSDAFSLLEHIRPGRWAYSTDLAISQFDQYRHLADLEAIIEEHSELAATLGTDYIVKPDIVIGRYPVEDNEINIENLIVGEDDLASYTPLRASNSNSQNQLLHASISCKWTIRSDRTQNTRTEALNLIRNRKGQLPHIVAVTAEPLPTRIAALALGTGDLDCVYHFALHEMVEVIQSVTNQDQLEVLNTLVEGRRLRDISDLPFDLAI